MVIHEICAICLDDTAYVKLGKRVVKPKESNCCKLVCGHIFHKKCIKQWYASKSPQREGDTLDTLCYGNACPCCRQRVRFRGVSFVYNVAILEYAHYLLKEPYSNYELDYDDEIRYIYYDNPGIMLFVNDMRACMFHFCSWQLLNSLKRESLKMY